jgi:AI-2 transport protein TqsA
VFPKAVREASRIGASGAVTLCAVLKLVVGGAALIVILAGIRATATILIPFVLAIFLALISFPLVRLLQHRGVPRLLAVFCTMLAVLAALVGPGALVVTAVRQFVTAVPGYEARLRQIRNEVLEWLQFAEDYQWLRTEAEGGDLERLMSIVDPAAVLGIVVAALTNVITLLSLVFLVVLIASFMLVEAANGLGQRHQVLPPPARAVIARIAREMQTWLWVKTLISLATGVAAGFWVAIVGVEFALLWGLTAFLLNYIPNLGSLIAAIPPALLALIQFGPVSAGLVVLGYIAINIAFGSVMEPYLMGRQIGLSPLVVLLSVILWGWMWGIAGMLLAVPITMALKFGLDSSEETRWIGDLLAGRPRPEA